MNRLAIIVLNWNGSDDAIECVDSLIKQTLKPTIVIVDNNSSDNSVAVFEEYISSHKKEKIICSPGHFRDQTALFCADEPDASVWFRD